MPPRPYGDAFDRAVRQNELPSPIPGSHSARRPPIHVQLDDTLTIIMTPPLLPPRAVLGMYGSLLSLSRVSTATIHTLTSMQSLGSLSSATCTAANWNSLHRLSLPVGGGTVDFKGGMSNQHSIYDGNQ